MKGVKPYHSLQFKLALLTMVIAILPALIVYITYSRVTKQVVMEKYTQTAVQAVFEVSKNIDQMLGNIVEYSDVILTNQDFLDSLRSREKFESNAFNAMLRNFFVSREDIEGIYVYSEPCGKSDYFGVTKTQSPDYHLYSAILKSTGQIIWFDTKAETIKILSGQFKKFHFTFARKIINLNSLAYMGVLAVDIDETLLDKACSGLISEPRASVVMISPDGQIISASDKSQIAVSVQGQAYMSGLGQQTELSGYFTYRDQGQNMVAIYATSQTTGWQIVKTVPTSDLYTAITSLDRILLSVVIIFAILGVITALVLSLFITRPIVALAQSMQKVEKGDLQVRVQPVRTDELGQLGTSFNFMLAEMNNLIERLVQEERTKKEIEMEVLRAQINPHFLYNTLNTISWMAKMQDATHISDAITALVKLLRISINLGKDMITLAEEIEYVKSYCLIQQLRFNNHFNVHYEIDEASARCLVPKLILQPIVENSLIYGSENHSGYYLEINLKSTVTGDRLVMTIQDNGPGIEDKIISTLFKDDQDVNKFSKVGLNNVQQRIKMNFGPEYGLSIDSKTGLGTTVTIELPARNSI